MQFAATRIDITPRRPVHLTCGADPDRTTSAVESTLEATVLCLRGSPDEPPVVLVGVDLLYPGPVLTEHLRSALPPEVADRVVVCASHTHQAPVTDPGKPGLGRFDAEYTRETGERIVAAITDCLAAERPVVSLRVGTSTAPLSVNRRRKKLVHLSSRPSFNRHVAAPNPAGPTDDTVTVITVAGDAGVECVIWNLACHPTGRPVSERIDADYPGRVRALVRESLGRDVPVLFLQGFSGNTRPAPTAIPHDTRTRLRETLTGGSFSKFSEETFARWCRDIFQEVTAARAASRAIAPTRLELASRAAPAADFLHGREGAVAGTRIALGDEVLLFLVTGELMAEHALRLRRDHPGRTVVPVGCVGDVVGYLPTPQIRREGGYEGGEFSGHFGVGQLTPGAGEAVDALLAGLNAPHAAV